MKRALTFLFAVVGCWTVSFVQAANVGLNFYSGVAGESVSVAEDVHYAVVGVDSKTIADGNLTAEDDGKAEVDINADSFYIVAEQSSTKFFGSVLVEKDAEDGNLFFILDASGLIWIKDAHCCPDDAECMKDGDKGNCDCCDGIFVGKQHNGDTYENGQCCKDDCCDADCICRKLTAYLAGKSVNGGSTISQGAESKAGQYSSTNSSTITNSPYSYGTSNFGTYGAGPSPYGGSWGQAGRLAGIGMLGLVGAVIAVAVADNSKPMPTSRAATPIEVNDK